MMDLVKLCIANIQIIRKYPLICLRCHILFIILYIFDIILRTNYSELNSQNPTLSIKNSEHSITARTVKNGRPFLNGLYLPANLFFKSINYY